MRFTEMKVWKKPQELVSKVYELTKLFPKYEQYELCKRMKSVAVIAPANIAKAIEGRRMDDLQYYIGLAVKNYAELDSHFAIAKSLDYLDEETLAAVQEDINSCRKLAYGFIRYRKNKIKDAKQTEQPIIRSEAA